MHSSNYSPHVRQTRNIWENLNKKSISRNTTHLQSLILQAVLTDETLKG